MTAVLRNQTSGGSQPISCFFKTALDAELFEVINTAPAPETAAEQLDRVTALLSQGADPNGLCYMLLPAIKDDETREWDDLRSQFESNMLEMYAKSALVSAVAKHNDALADLLVAKGADPRAAVDGVDCVRNEDDGKWKLELVAAANTEDAATSDDADQDPADSEERALLEGESEN